jgi:hypothetical protein
MSAEVDKNLLRPDEMPKNDDPVSVREADRAGGRPNNGGQGAFWAAVVFKVFFVRNPQVWL